MTTFISHVTLVTHNTLSLNTVKNVKLNLLGIFNVLRYLLIACFQHISNSQRKMHWFSHAREFSDS